MGKALSGAGATLLPEKSSSSSKPSRSTTFAGFGASLAGGGADCVGERSADPPLEPANEFDLRDDTS